VNVAAPARASRPFIVGLLAIAGGALAIRLAYDIIVDPHVAQLSDATAYHLLGRNLADGRGYIRPFDFELLGKLRPTAEYPPLFPFFLAALTTIGAGSVHNQELVLTVVGTTTVVLTGLIGRRVAGDTAGLVAAGIAAIHPMLFQADGILMTESLAAALVAGCVLLALHARARPTFGVFVALGALLAVTTLERAEGLLLAPILVLPLAIRLRDVPAARRALLAVTALATMAVVLAPWTIDNERRFHTIIPVSNNLGTVVEGANCDLTYSGAALGSWRSEFATGRSSTFQCFPGFAIQDPHFDEATAAAQARRRGVDYATHHKDRWPVVALARVGRTWGVFRPAQQINLGVLEGRVHRFEAAGTWLHWILLPFAVVGVIVLYRRRAPLWPLLAPIVTVTLVSVLTYGSQRFRITADPMLAVLAAVALTTGFEATRARARAGAGSAAPVT
jgi:4-amino-4-deoxy-L-arabinose transferase-like glycosyltransferase